jgi:hypothetical protein
VRAEVDETMQRQAQRALEQRERTPRSASPRNPLALLGLGRHLATARTRANRGALCAAK